MSEYELPVDEVIGPYLADWPAREDKHHHCAEVRDADHHNEHPASPENGHLALLRDLEDVLDLPEDAELCSVHRKTVQYLNGIDVLGGQTTVICGAGYQTYSKSYEEVTNSDVPLVLGAAIPVCFEL